MMITIVLLSYLFTSAICAPTTISPMGSTIYSTIQSTTTNLPTDNKKFTATLSPNIYTTITSESNMITETSKSPNLLRKGFTDSINPYSFKGRVILANTRENGNTEWGLTAQQAEIACEKLAKQQEISQPGLSTLSSLLERFVKTKIQTPSAMEGHLLSLGSSSQVVTLSELLNPVPSGAYWTGGKLMRLKPNNPMHHITTSRLVLTWTDGRISSAKVLGMTKEDEDRLEEGITYCLALDISTRTWQARDCDDRLPYACLITPRHVTFSNRVGQAMSTGLPFNRMGLTEAPEMIDSLSERIRNRFDNIESGRSNVFATTPKILAAPASTDGKIVNPVQSIITPTSNPWKPTATPNPSTVLSDKTTNEKNTAPQPFVQPVFGNENKQTTATVKTAIKFLEESNLKSLPSTMESKESLSLNTPLPERNIAPIPAVVGVNDKRKNNDNDNNDNGDDDDDNDNGEKRNRFTINPSRILKATESSTQSSKMSTSKPHQLTQNFDNTIPIIRSKMHTIQPASMRQTEGMNINPDRKLTMSMKYITSNPIKNSQTDKSNIQQTTSKN